MRPEIPESAPRATAAVYVLNLSTSTVPQDPRRVAAQHPDLVGFQFFTTRQFDGGRQRFRLHMGYFTSLQEARQWLGALRVEYPTAWAGPAPGRETAPPAATRPIRPIRPLPLARSTPQRPPERRRPIPVPAPRAAPTSPQWGTGEHMQPSVARALTQPVAAPPPRVRTPPAPVARKPLPARPAPAVRRTLPQPARPPRAAASAPAPAPAPAPDLRRATTYFAVQLLWSTEPVEIEEIPQLPILNYYTLYTVEGTRGAEHWHAVRVGFFNDAAVARKLASQLISEFTSAAVVPVSAQEKRTASGEEGSVDRVAAAAPAQAVESSRDRALRRMSPPPAPRKPAPPPPPKPSPVAQAKPSPTPQAKPSPAAQAKPSPAAQALEESLEILGASGSYPMLTGTQRRRARIQKSRSFFGLFERLGSRKD